MKKGFTLAEVLITLVVIGIVAAITVKVIINNQEEAYKTALKKNYTVIQQAFKKAITDNGGFIPLAYGNGFKEVSEALFTKTLNIAKDCGKKACVEPKKIDIYNLTGTTRFLTIDANVLYPGSILLQDGSFYKIYSVSSSPQNQTLSSLTLMIDVNGPYKKPNRLGKDVFFFIYNVQEEKLIPGGAPNTGFNVCDATSSNIWNGAGCTDKILRNEKIPR